VYKHGDIKNKIVSRSIGLSYLANLFLPFRMGEFLRLAYLRKNGFGTTASSFAIITERILDSILLTFYFGVYFFIEGSKFQEFLFISFSISLMLSLVLFLLLKPRSEKLRILRIFSEDVALRLHQIAFQIYLSVIKFRVNFMRIILFSAVINLGVFYSVTLFAKSLNVDLPKIANVLLFDLSNSISLASIKLISNSGQIILVLIYLLAPIVVLSIPLSRLDKLESIRKRSPEDETLGSIVFPELRSRNNDAYFKEAISSIASRGKKGISVLQSETLKGEKLVEVLQGGASGDHVFLIDGDTGLQVRKSATGLRRDFLKAQNTWLRDNSRLVPVVETQSFVETENTVYYDMKYLGRDASFFTALHSNNLLSNKVLLEELLERLKSGPLEEEGASLGFSTYGDTYRRKVIKSYEIINKKNLGIFLSQSLQFCGIHLKALELDSILNFASSQKLPKGEKWLMHGDLTVSNLMIDKELVIKLIDPNPIQPFSHPTVDFGKLYQSFKCGFEFDYSSPVLIEEDENIKMICTRSSTYAQMEKFLNDWITSNYSEEYLFHSTIQLLFHLTRIIPYSQSPEQIKWIIFQMRIIYTELVEGKQFIH
jgi:hypothetical protein